MATKFKSAKNKFDALRNKLKTAQDAKSGGQTYDDSWKFKPALVGAKSEYRVRILPHIHVDDGLAEPWVKTYSHMYNRPSDGKYIYVQCPTTYDEKGFDKCPICAKSKELFGKETATSEEQARKMYRKPRYFVNVYVKEDPRSGEDSQKGKVLVWEVGQQIFDKFHDALVDQELDFYDPEAGNDFLVKIKKKGGYTNYEMSHFNLKPCPIVEDEDLMNEIHSQIYNINEKVLVGAKTPELLETIMTGKKVEKEQHKPTTRDSDNEGEEELDESDESDDEVIKDKDLDIDNDEPAESDEDDSDDSEADDDDIDLDELFK